MSKRTVFWGSAGVLAYVCGLPAARRRQGAPCAAAYCGARLVADGHCGHSAHNEVGIIGKLGEHARSAIRPRGSGSSSPPTALTTERTTWCVPTRRTPVCSRTRGGQERGHKRRSHGRAGGHPRLHRRRREDDRARAPYLVAPFADREVGGVAGERRHRHASPEGPGRDEQARAPEAPEPLRERDLCRGPDLCSSPRALSTGTVQRPRRLLDLDARHSLALATHLRAPCGHLSLHGRHPRQQPVRAQVRDRPVSPHLWLARGLPEPRRARVLRAPALLAQAASSAGVLPLVGLAATAPALWSQGASTGSPHLPRPVCTAPRWRACSCAAHGWTFEGAEGAGNRSGQRRRARSPSLSAPGRRPRDDMWAPQRVPRVPPPDRQPDGITRPRRPEA